MFYRLVFFCTIASGFAIPLNRIIGGQTAEPGRFPHQISLRINNQHICGGSIIGPTKILTAAHCVFGHSRPMTVVAGVTQLTSNNGQSISIYSVAAHESFDPETLENDIAVLTLRAPLSFNSLVQPIQLRSAPVESGETTILSGWGLTVYPGTTLPNDLQFMQMKALDLNSCSEALPGTLITPGNVCTISPVNEGACQGDSGGALVDENGAQIGVASSGVPCAKGFPDIFTSVSFYKSWILDQ